MEEIKVGEYVRTKDGYIGKYVKDGLAHKTIEIKDNEMSWITGESNISKHSPNITDLIEVGDIVHTKDVLNEDYYWMFDKEMVQATKETIEEGITLIDILTHEQYQNNCYRV